MEQKTCPHKRGTGRIRRNAPACLPIGALMRYGERIVRVVAEASGQRVIIESMDEDGRTFRSTVKWASLSALHDQLF
jgi:Ribonuclease G/E